MNEFTPRTAEDLPRYIKTQIEEYPNKAIFALILIGDDELSMAEAMANLPDNVRGRLLLNVNIHRGTQ